MKLIKYMLFSLLLFSQVTVAAGQRVVAGTGWFASDNGYIVTNAHVVAHIKKEGPIYVMVNGKNYTATLVGLDMRYDVGVVKINISNHTCLPIKHTRLNVDDSVTGILFTLTKEGNFNDFFTSSIELRTSTIVKVLGSFNIPGLPFMYLNSYQATAIGIKGNSGSPLVDSDGFVVAMLFGGYTTPFGDYNIFLPTSDIFNTFASSEISPVCKKPSSQLTDTLVRVYGPADDKATQNVILI